MVRKRVGVVAAAVLVSSACSGSGGSDGPDTTAPSVSIVSPAADDTLATPDVVLRALVSDAGGLASIEYAVDAGAFLALPAASGGYETHVPLPLADGIPTTLTVRARDLAGNEASATRSIRVDRVAPALSLGGVDAACAERCTGDVVRANEPAYHLTGSAVDGSGLAMGQVLVIVTDEAGTQVASADVPVDGAGAFAWDWDVYANGELFTLTVRADDLKGNTASAVRKVYVDHVSPTLTAGPTTPSPRSGPLVTFSEPMDEASVEGATALSLADGTPVAATLSWASASSFGFTPDLVPFTDYRIVIGTGATDRAGKPLAAYWTSFQTEMIPPPAGPSEVASGARRPRLEIFADGRPVALYASAAGGQPRIVFWDGRGSWVDREIPNAALAGGAPEDAIANQYGFVSALLSVPGSGLYYVRTADLSTWTGWSGDVAEDQVAASISTGWSAAFGTQCLLWPCVTTALFGDAAGAEYSRRDPTAWSAANLVKATGPGAHGAGNAFVDDAVYYLDTRLTAPFYRAVTNAISGVGRVVGRETDGANPLVAYTTPRAGSSPAADDLHLACMSAPPWFENPVALDGTVGGLDLTVSPTTAGVAVAVGTQVRFATFANGSLQCTSAPLAPAWQPSVDDAQEPSVALGSDGTTLWKAWVRTPTGELVIGR